MKAKNTFTTILSVLLTVVIIVLSTAYAIPTAYATENTWDPSNGVYNISTEADLFAFRDSLDAGEDYDGIEINLLNDIEISQGTTYVSPCANRDEGLYAFCGTFNGNNHTISNLNMVSSDDSTVSFLPILYYGTIKDLTLKDVTIENGTTWNAAFVSISYGNDKIINCHLEGNCLIQADKNFTGGSNFTAGFVASNYRAGLEVRDCTIGEDVQIIGTTDAANYGYVGGILAFARKASTSILISGCENRAYVESVYVGGGIAGYVDTDNGYSYSVTITDCINYGTIYSPTISNGAKYFAGILAKDFKWTTVIVDRCVNHGDITVHGYSASGSGGVVGEVTNCAIQNSYNTGTITATSQNNIIGGIAGQFRTSQIENIVYAGGSQTYYNPETFNSIVNCYNTGNVSGANTDYVGGICGIIQDTSSTKDHSIIENAYNFGTISGGKQVGNACAEIQTSYVTNTFSPSGTACIETDSGYSNSISHIGYFTSADTNGIIYPATISAGQSEVISAQPLSDNLLDTLNQWVSDKNSALEAGGNDYRYLTWKMTNPASEDGSKGVTVHPMFGVLEEQGLRFHVNEPGETDRLFRVYDGDASEAEDTTAYTLTNGKVDDFYAVPAFAGDNYVFAGWYYNQSDGTTDGNTAFDFSSAVPEGVTDVYAHWIAVGTVNKDSEDSNLISGDYRGFGLAGVQIRDPKLFDSNYNTDYNDETDRTPGGMRFVTSLSESLLSSIDALSSNKVNTTGGNVDVEYGYVVGTEKTIAEYIDGVGNNWTTPVTGHYKGVDLAKYRLLYKGENVNGVNTAGATQTADTDFRYITNVNCTRGTTNSMGTIKEDHHSFTNYRLYSLVVTYEGESESKKGENVDARAYIRYYDANGKLRVFYNDYRNASNVTYYGGCMCSFDQVSSMAIPQDPTLLE